MNLINRYMGWKINRINHRISYLKSLDIKNPKTEDEMLYNLDLSTKRLNLSFTANQIMLKLKDKHRDLGCLISDLEYE